MMTRSRLKSCRTGNPDKAAAKRMNTRAGKYSSFKNNSWRSEALTFKNWRRTKYSMILSWLRQREN